jgi:hypothetical protein
MTPDIERRAAPEFRAASPGKLVGYAAVFDAPSADLGGFVEIVRPGAFRRALANASHVRALYDHDSGHVLGRVGAGTLRLAEDARGLRFEIDLPPTTVARDLSVLVERGDVSGASFAFRVPKGGDRWTGTQRELLDVDLEEITVTARPAYVDTSVARRSMPSIYTTRGLLVLDRRYLETLG